MKTKYLLILFALGLGLALVCVLGGRITPLAAAPRAEGDIEAPGAPADELHVCPSGCTYSSIQDAVDAANDGDVIKVAAGTYTGVNHHGGLVQVVYISKTVTVRGGYTTFDWTTYDPESNPTTLNALGQGRVMYITGDISPTIEGLRITGGTTAGLDPSEYAGGGVFVITATATISDNHVFGNTAETGGGLGLISSNASPSGNTITSNTADRGGGLYLWGSDATLSGNTITGNTAEREGGGGLYLWGSDATLSGNTITGNTATEGAGGGLWLGRSAAALSGNTISANTARQGAGLLLHFSDATLINNAITDNTADYDGGGLYLRGSDATLDDNTISDNTAAIGGRGGGLFLSWDSDATLSGNSITSNSALDGGGLYLDWGSDATLINNVVTDNQASRSGSGLFVGGVDGDSSPHLLHNTIAHNTGGDGSGVRVGSGSVVLTNNILANHAVGIYIESGNMATLESTLWNGNTTDWSGGGTINRNNDHTGDPTFVDPDNGDYHIGPASAAIDAGVDAGVADDIDGDPRPAAFGSDIGADERPGVSLHIRKVAWPPLLDPGQTLTYTLIVTSAGVDTATDVWLTDTLPSLQQVVDITTTRGSCTAETGWGDTATCDLGTMVPGDIARITLTARVTTSPVQLPWWMRNTIWVSAAETSNTAYAYTTLHDCHTRLNDSPAEYSTVQAAVDASTRPSDVVKVSGSCAGVTQRAGVAQVVYLSKTLTLQGGWNAAFTKRNVTSFPTTLDAMGQGRVLYIADDISPTVEGLSITGGDAVGLGGGRGKSFMALPHDAGGGAYINATTTLKDSQVFSNAAEWGGGLYLAADSDTILSDNTVSDNTAEWGGGIYIDWYSDATLVNNMVTDNQANNQGSGLYVEGSSLRLLHTTIAHNIGGNGSGVYITEGRSCGRDSCIFQYNTAALTNTILVSHTVGITFTAGNTTTLEGTLWGTGAWANDIDWGGEGTIFTGTVNLWGDPAFANPNNGDYHIGPGSAAIDTGVDAGVDHDIDGDPRPLGSGYDLGADEVGLFVTKQAYPDPVQPGAPLTYTIRITNTTDEDLHATITDTLPLSVTLVEASGGTLVLPGGTLAPPDGTVVLPDGRVAVTWTPVITAPGGLWIGTIRVTVDEGYAGPLTNLVEVTTEEGAAGEDSVTVVASRRVYLPLVMREFL